MQYVTELSNNVADSEIKVKPLKCNFMTHFTFQH